MKDTIQVENTEREDCMFDKFLDSKWCRPVCFAGIVILLSIAYWI